MLMKKLLPLFLLYTFIAKSKAGLPSLPSRSSTPSRSSSSRSSPSRFSNSSGTVHKTGGKNIDVLDFESSLSFVAAVVILVFLIRARVRTKKSCKKNNVKQTKKESRIKTHYDLLCVSSNAPQEEIKAQYRKLVWQYHPDRNRGNEKKAEISFKKISAAYDTLKDTNARKEYDNMLQDSKGSYGKPSEESSRKESWEFSFLLVCLLSYIFLYLYKVYALSFTMNYTDIVIIFCSTIIFNSVKMIVAFFFVACIAVAWDKWLR
jgi:DnaJ-domain-containing protein 1